MLIAVHRVKSWRCDIEPFFNKKESISLIFSHQRAVFHNIFGSDQDQALTLV